MQPSDEGLLGRGDVDGEHARLFARLERLENCSDADLPARLREFTADARTHFDHEDRLMADGDFPTRDCHLQEHAAVLASLTAVITRLDSGEIALARRLVRELRRWLPEHIRALDHALVQWLFRRETGGARLVLTPIRRTPKTMDVLQ